MLLTGYVAELRSRSLTPTLHEAEWTAPSSPYSGARGSVGTSGQQLTPPPSEPGSPRLGNAALPLSSSTHLPTPPLTIPSKYSEHTCSHSSPTRNRGCSSPSSFRSSAGSKVSISPRVSCSPRSSTGFKASTSPKVSTSPKCGGNGSTVARKRASMSPRSSPVLA